MNNELDTNLKIEINSEFLNKKGLCGITNLGNTCYMNSILQCLNNTLPLLKFFVSNNYMQYINYTTDANEHEIVIEYNKLTRGLWFKNNVVTPRQFLNTIHRLANEKNRYEFTGLGQNDSQEFLQFLLEILHNSLSREVNMSISGIAKNDMDKKAIEANKDWIKYFDKEYSEIVKIFYGQFFTRIFRQKDEKTGKEAETTSFEPFNTLCLEIDECKTIYDCLDNFVRKEELNKKISKEVQFWKLPNILVIFFKRYNNSGKKLDNHIEFPTENLDMCKYVMGYERQKYIYDLYAVSNHTGNTMGGHYWAYAKNYDNNWYKFNDNIVTTLQKEKVVSNLAYCLFYKLKDI